MREAKQIPWHSIPVTKISRWIPVAQEETSPAYWDFFPPAEGHAQCITILAMDSRLSAQKGILFKVSFTSQSPKETCAESLGAINVRILIYRPWPISETFGSTVRFWSLINIFFRFCWKSPGSLGITFVAFSITYQADALCTGAFTHDEQ